jgi:hypothetical protein
MMIRPKNLMTVTEQSNRENSTVRVLNSLENLTVKVLSSSGSLILEQARNSSCPNWKEKNRFWYRMNGKAPVWSLPCFPDSGNHFVVLRLPVAYRHFFPCWMVQIA